MSRDLIVTARWEWTDRDLLELNFLSSFKKHYSYNRLKAIKGDKHALRSNGHARDQNTHSTLGQH
jgi:hypothetical protein